MSRQLADVPGYEHHGIRIVRSAQPSIKPSPLAAQTPAET
jgi:hypothetical protein